MQIKLTPDVTPVGQKAEDLPEGVLLRYKGTAGVFIRIRTQLIGFSPRDEKPWISSCNNYPDWTIAPAGTKLTLEQE